MALLVLGNRLLQSRHTGQQKPMKRCEKLIDSFLIQTLKFLSATAFREIISRIALIWIVGVGIIRIRIVGIIGIWIREPETDWESEADEDRIGPEKTVIGEEAIIRKETTINEKAIIGEKAAVKIIESTVEKSTAPSKARTLELVEPATVKTHATSLKTSRTTAMKTATAKT
jgi:hypothetical protein